MQAYPNAAGEVLEKERGRFFDGFTVADRASDDHGTRRSKRVDAALMRSDGHGHSVRLLDLLDNGHLWSVAHGRRQRKRREIEHEHQRLQILQMTTKTAHVRILIFHREFATSGFKIRKSSRILPHFQSS